MKMTEKCKVNVIKNIGNLNILSNEEVGILKQTEVIKNIGNLVLRVGFYSKYPNISMKNIGNTIVVPMGVEVSTHLGSLTIDQQYLESLTSQICLVVTGVVIVSPGIDPELFAAKISTLNLLGVVVCPESATGIVNSKLQGQTGITITYKDDERANVIMENDEVTFTDDYFKALEGKVILLINGTADASKALNMSIVKEKILTLVINGEIIINEENAALVAMAKINGDKITVPAGYEYISGDMQLSETNINEYKGRGIFTTDTVTFDENLTSELISANSFKLDCKKVIYKSTIEKGVSLLLSNQNTDKISYENKLITNHTSRIVTSKELEYTEGAIHLLNYGDLKIEKDMEDDVFFKKISGIHNYGKIECSSDSYGLVQLKIVDNMGAIALYEDAQPESDVIEVILLGNVGNANI